MVGVEAVVAAVVVAEMMMKWSTMMMEWLRTTTGSVWS